MFGESAVPKSFKDDLLKITVNGKEVEVDMMKLDVTSEDEILRDMIFTAINKLNQVLVN